MKRIIKSILKRTLVISYFSVVVLMLSACEKPKPELGLKTGIWRGEIRAQENAIPFNFEVAKNEGSYQIELINGEERLDIDAVNIANDIYGPDVSIIKGRSMRKQPEVVTTGNLDVPKSAHDRFSELEL